MVTEKNILETGGCRSIDSVMSHITSVLSEAFPSYTWMITTRTISGWLVIHVNDSSFGLQVSDVLLDNDYQSPIFHDGISVLSPELRVVAEREKETFECRSVKGIIFHRIITQSGGVFGAIAGFSNRKISHRTQRFLPLLGLLSETLMLSYKMCSELEFKQQAHAEAEHDANHDPLTGLLNLRGWEQAVTYEIKRKSRTQTPLSFLMIDIDNFKSFNDNGGHAQGDAILRRVARLLKDNTRETDAVARLGGDEFAILACDADSLSASNMAKSLESILKEEGVSCSIGVSEMEKGKAWRDSLEEADRLMYKNKRQQRPNVL